MRLSPGGQKHATWSELTRLVDRLEKKQDDDDATRLLSKLTQLEDGELVPEPVMVMTNLEEPAVAIGGLKPQADGVIQLTKSQVAQARRPVTTEDLCYRLTIMGRA